MSLVRTLQDAVRHPMMAGMRLELGVVEGGLRVQVSQQGSRIVGCVVPWSEIADAAASPLPGTIDRCQQEIIRRHAT